MTQEQLQKAKELQGNIEMFEQHLEDVETAHNRNRTTINGHFVRNTLLIGVVGLEHCNITLTEDLYAIKLDDFMRIYILNVKNKIKQLKEEFEKL